MKKIIPGVLLLLAFAAAAFFVLKAKRYLPERPRGAELVPEDTVFFAQLPSLRQTAVRFPRTGLYKLWEEPEIQAFLEKPRQKMPQFKQWTQMIPDLLEVMPGEAFAAVTALEGSKAKFVAGFSFAGSRSAVESLLKPSRTAFRKAWPTGKADLASYKAHEIESYTYAQGIIAESYCESWYFISNDVRLLESTLDRHDLQEGLTAGTLAGTELFQKAMAPHATDADAFLFAKPGVLTQRIDSLLAATTPVNKAPEKPSAEKAWSMATKLDGKHIRDTLFILGGEASQKEPLTRETVGFCGPQTFFYYAGEMPQTMPGLESAGVLRNYVPGFMELEARLESAGLGFKDIPVAFGPELGLIFDWSEGSAMPAILVAAEVKDKELSRRFVDAWAGTKGQPGAWGREQLEGALVLRSPGSDFAMTQPTLAINESHVLFGLSAPTVIGGLQRMAKNEGLDARLAEAPGVQLKTTPTSAFGYFDSKGLFERAYALYRPFISMSLMFSPEAGSYIDAGKLPTAEAVSKHLGPSVYGQSVTKDGVLIESTGTLTFNQWLVGVIGGTAAVAMPSIESAVAANLKNEAGVGSSPVQGILSPKSPTTAPEAAAPEASGEAAASGITPPAKVPLEP